MRAERTIALALLLVAGGCAKPIARPTPRPPVESAWSDYFAGKTAQARAGFDRALEVRPGERPDPRALFGRALVAESAGELARAWDDEYAIVAGGAAPLLKTAAVRHLEGLLGEIPDERAGERQKRLAALDLGGLPLSVAREVAELRAAYARRAGDEPQARALDLAAGCPDHFWVTGPYGKLPRLDLSTPFSPEHEGDESGGSYRRAPSRACNVTLLGARPRSGVLYAVGWVKASRDQRALFTVESDEPWRLYIDGQALFDQRDEDRYPPRVRELAVELPRGWHRIAVKVAAPGGRAELGLSALASPPLEMFTGTPDHAPRLSPDNLTVQVLDLAPHPGPDALDQLIAAEGALAIEDSDRGAERLSRVIAAAPRFAPALLERAELALADPSRPPAVAQDRARRDLEAALALDPGLERARYLRAQMALGGDRPREALKWLADAPKGEQSWRFSYARFQAEKARGFQREAEESLSLARRLAPSACPPLRAELSVERERRDLPKALDLARRAVHCGGGGDDLADLLRSAGELSGAIAEYRRLTALDPARETFAAGLAETLAQAGREREAAEAFTVLAEKHPRSTQYRRELADARVALGDEKGARRALEEGLALSPESRELRRALEGLCEERPGQAPRCGLMDPFRIDGKQVIAAYQHDKSRPAYRSPAVIVLDRTVTRVFPTGARLTLTHNIIQVLAKDGIDKWGEVQIPEGADILTLRTVKADGSTREPEEIDGKDSVSVPDLEVGDYVEFEYVDPAPPPGAFPGGFLGERFYFRSYDAPLDRTEYLLVTPKGMPVEVDRRGDAPQMKLSRAGNLDERLWAGRHKPQAFAEPASAPFGEFIPSVRAGSGVSFLAWKDYLRDGEFGAERSNGELRALAARLTQGQKTEAERLAALDAWVRRHVKGSGPLDEPATSILAREEGSRVTLLAALVRASGVKSTIWLAHPAGTAILDGPLPDLEGYSQPLLFTDGRILDPRFRHSGTGFVTPQLRGVRALPLDPGPVDLTEVLVKNPDHRRMELDATLVEDGSAEVKVKETLRGWPAVEWREALEKLPPDQVRPAFEQRTLGFYFPGATLEDLAWQGQDDDDGPFVVEYRFHAPALARRVGDHLVLPAPYPALLGQRYVGVAQRTTPLQLDYTSPTSLEARFTLPRGATLELPPPVKVEGFGLLEQRAVRTPNGLSLTARFEMPRMQVPTDRYPAFVDFATRVDRAEARAAEIAVPSSPAK